MLSFLVCGLSALAEESSKMMWTLCSVRRVQQRYACILWELASITLCLWTLCFAEVSSRESAAYGRPQVELGYAQTLQG